MSLTSTPSGAVVLTRRPDVVGRLANPKRIPPLNRRRSPLRTGVQDAFGQLLGVGADVSRSKQVDAR